MERTLISTSWTKGSSFLIPALDDFFVNPRIQESALNLTEDDFDNQRSITTIRSKSY